MRKICLAVLLLPALAWAEPKSADDWYKEGANQYNLGNFDKAVEAFKRGFELEPDDSKKPIYLYNVAQSYRLANDCKNALFFYRRFLSLKANDPSKPIPAKTRKEIEDRIPELEACVQQQSSISKKPPNNNLPPNGNGNADGDGDKTPPDGGDRKDPHKDPHKVVAKGNGNGDGEEDDGGGVTKPARFAGPHVISARLTGGVTKVNAGNVIRVPPKVTFGLLAGYPIAINKQLTIDAGAAFTFTPVPYTTNTMTSSTAQLWGAMADAGATFEVIPKLGLRADVGVGALFFAGVNESPFTNNAPTSGALTMFHFRGAVSADYAVTPNIVITVTPFAFSYSPPKAGLDMSITAITSIDFMAGIGFRM
jgi:tetratricopeptide repeat protein